MVPVAGGAGYNAGDAQRQIFSGQIVLVGGIRRILVCTSDTTFFVAETAIMNTSSWQDELSAKVPQLQIIVGSLVSGCVIFAVIAIFLPAQAAKPAADQLPIVTYVAILFGAMSLFAAWLVPNIMLAKTRRDVLSGNCQPPQGLQGQRAEDMAEMLERCGDAGRLWLAFMARTIIRAAMLEGAAFFMLVTYMVEQQPVAICAAVIWIVFVAAQFPTRNRSMHWIEDQLNVIEQQRQLGD